MPELTTCEDASAWDAFVSQARDGSILQSWAWGSLKARYGWRVARYFWIVGDRPAAAASVLRRGLPGGFALDYAPRGPVLDGNLEQWPAFWQSLREQLAAEGAPSSRSTRNGRLSRSAGSSSAQVRCRAALRSHTTRRCW